MIKEGQSGNLVCLFFCQLLKIKKRTKRNRHQIYFHCLIFFVENLRKYYHNDEIIISKQKAILLKDKN